MQYNEDYMLPVFLDHYSRFLDRKHIKIIDHGSTNIDLSMLEGYEKIYIPRDRPFGEWPRLRIVQHFVAGLLEYYDFGIFVDCDELIDLTHIDKIDFSTNRIHYVAGFDVFFRNTPDGLRLRGLLNPGYCKPSIFSYMPYWTTGFHDAETSMNLLEFPMVHTAFLYPHKTHERLKKRHDVHQQIADSERKCKVNAHWDNGLDHLNSFYNYIHTKNNNVIKEFSPIDPTPFIEQTEAEKRYRFSTTEYDLTDRFPHVVHNYVKELMSM